MTDNLRHITPMEFSLYYEGKLSRSDVERVEAHLENCGDCAEQYEMMSESLNDLHDGKIRKMWPWQFRRFWQHVVAAGSEFAGSASPTRVPSPMGGMGRTLDLVTAAPGLGTGEEKTALVVGKELRRVRADWELAYREEGLVYLALRIGEMVSDLKGGQVTGELRDGKRTIPIGSDVLKLAEDRYGPYLRAELQQRLKGRRQYTEEQIRDMEVLIKVQPAERN